MKRVILFSILSVLLCSAPGHAGQKEKQKRLAPAQKRKDVRVAAAIDKTAAAREKAAALPRMRASVAKFEKQATAYCTRLATAFHACQEKAIGDYEELDAAKNFIGARETLNPLDLVSVKLSGPKEEVFALEKKTVNRAGAITEYAYRRAVAANEAALSAKRYCKAEAAQAKAAAVPKRLQDLYLEITRVGGDIHLRRTQQERLDISRRLAEEQKEMLAQMEQEHRKLLENDIQNQNKLRDLVDAEQYEVQQLFDVVAGYYGPFFKQRAGAFDVDAFDKARTMVDLAKDLWTKTNDLFARVNDSAEEMRKECSRNIALAQKELAACDNAGQAWLSHAKAKAARKAAAAPRAQADDGEDQDK